MSVALGHAAVTFKVGLRPPDVICQTRTPVILGAVGTAQAVTSKRKPNDQFAGKWLRVRDVNQWCRPTSASGAGD